MPDDNRIIFLSSKRIILRPLEKADAPAYTKWLNAPDVRQYLMAYWPLMLEEEEGYIAERTKERTNLNLAIELRENSELIGSVGLSSINYRMQTATSGSFIGDDPHHGKGLGTEAKMLLLHYAFTELNLRKIKSRVFATNLRSVAALKKQGYEIEGTLREEIFRNGTFLDEVLLAVFRDDFMKIWEQQKS